MAEAAVHMTQAAATQWAFAVATARAATATAQARSATATARVQATATAQTATQQAYALAWTQQAVDNMSTATAQALTIQGTATAQTVAAQATALAAEAEKVQLEVQQQRMMNQVWAVTKWGLVLVFVGLLLLIAHRLTSTRIVKRENGKVLVLTGGVVYDPDRNPTPLLRLTDKSQADMPPASPAAQEAATARDQAIALAKALAGRRPPSALRHMTPAPVAPAPAMPPVQVEVIPPERVRPWLDDVEKQLPLGVDEEVTV